MAAAHDVQALLAQLASKGRLRLAHDAPASVPSALALDWPELDATLPDRGLPKGVVELAAPHALGGSTSVAMAAVRAAQSREANGWCAWIDPEATLHAPGLVSRGVDLARLLVVRAPRAQLARVAVKVVASTAFDVVVVDLDVVPGGRSREPNAARRATVPELFVRKLALAAEPSGATVLLLTDALRPRVVAWPVALRVELSRPSARELTVRIAKDKRGRIGVAKTIPFRPVLDVAG